MHDTTAPMAVPTSHGPVEAVIHGSGQPILALHGGMGGHDQGTLLARSSFVRPVRIVAVSRPGYLGTPLGDTKAPEAQADLYTALLDALRIERVVVIAVSAGGPSALAFAKRHAARCSGLILVSTCTGRLDIPPELTRRMPMIRFFARLPWLAGFMRRKAIRHPQRGAQRSIRDPELAARTLAAPDSGPLFKLLLASTFDRLADRLPGTLNDMALFSVQPDISVGELSVPLLVIHGTADRVVPFAHADRIAREAPDATFLPITDGEHVSLFTHMREIRTHVEAFLERIGAGAAHHSPARTATSAAATGNTSA